jgi:hypothetical protein
MTLSGIFAICLRISWMFVFKDRIAAARKMSGIDNGTSVPERQPAIATCTKTRLQNRASHVGVHTSHARCRLLAAASVNDGRPSCARCKQALGQRTDDDRTARMRAHRAIHRSQDVGLTSDLTAFGPGAFAVFSHRRKPFELQPPAIPTGLARVGFVIPWT